MSNIPIRRLIQIQQRTTQKMFAVRGGRGGGGGKDIDDEDKKWEVTCIQ